MPEPELTVEESLCDAILIHFGLPGPLRDENWEGSLATARDMVRPQAREIIEALQDDGFEITRRA